jgi:hypothetical protein
MENSPYNPQERLNEVEKNIFSGISTWNFLASALGIFWH